MPTLEEIQARFSADAFAAQTTGAKIILAEPGHAVCQMEAGPQHMNANGVVQGGAVFTLADFAFAIAVNGHAPDITVSQHMAITFLAAAKGRLLTAEASCVKAGRRTCLYEVKVTDDQGVFVAHATVNGFTVGEFRRGN